VPIAGKIYVFKLADGRRCHMRWNTAQSGGRRHAARPAMRGELDPA
jgi:hypothetical protein